MNAMSWTKTIAETVFVYSAALTMVMPADRSCSRRFLATIRNIGIRSMKS